METIGNKIKRIRKDNNLSLMQLAKTINVSDMTLYKIETGKTKSITIEIGIGIAKALGVPFNELFEIEVGFLPKEEGLIQIEDLKAKIEELKERISEKDQLINAITNQNKLLKSYFLTYLTSEFRDEIIQNTIKINETIDENEKQNLTKRIAYLQDGLKYEFQFYISLGIISQSDVDEFNEFNTKISIKKPGM